MSILAAEILARVIKLTGRKSLTMSDDGEHDIEQDFIETLIEMSRRGNFLSAQVTGTLTSASKTITKPTDIRALKGIYIDDATDPLEQMEKYPRKEELSTGEPTHYDPQGLYWRLYPLPDGNYSYTVDYWKIHAYSTTVEFPDLKEWRKAICEGTAYKVAYRYNMKDKGDLLRIQFEETMDALEEEGDMEIHIAEYRDLS